MIGNKRVIALVPARGGSKSVPMKNLQLLGSDPLVAWPIKQAIETKEIDRVIVSTDDEAIADVARRSGAEVYKRSVDLASDTALVVDVIRDLWSTLKVEGETAEILVLLEATSPFREHGLISRCLKRLEGDGLDSIATFSSAAINPERTWLVESGVPRPFLDDAIPWKPRQQLKEAFQLNGAVYAFRPDQLPPDALGLLFGRSGAEIVDQESVVDIDDKRDFIIANAILNAR